MKILRLASVCLAFSAITLSGCQKESAPVEAPEGIPGVTISDGRLVLPAVAGNPGAVYFDIANNGDNFATIRAVSVAAAKSAMMHETRDEGGKSTMVDLNTLNINKGEPVKFEPGGKHVMAMELDPALKAGDSTEVTLTFVGGDKMSFPAKVEAAGGKD